MKHEACRGLELRCMRIGAGDGGCVVDACESGGDRDVWIASRPCDDRPLSECQRAPSFEKRLFGDVSVSVCDVPESESSI